MKSDRDALRAVETPEQPPYLVTRVMAEVRSAHEGATARRRVWWRRALPAAAAALLVAAGLWFGAQVGSEFGQGTLTQDAMYDGDVQSFADFTETVFGEE